MIETNNNKNKNNNSINNNTCDNSNVEIIEEYKLEEASGIQEKTINCMTLNNSVDSNTTLHNNNNNSNYNQTHSTNNNGKINNIVNKFAIKMRKSKSMNYFPNDRKKHIDYVIHYKEASANDTKFVKDIRENFFKALEKEGFSLQRITVDRDKNDNSKSVYVFLNCKLERLMEEAERTHLEVPLKNVKII